MYRQYDFSSLSLNKLTIPEIHHATASRLITPILAFLQLPHFGRWSALLSFPFIQRKNGDRQHVESTVDILSSFLNIKILSHPCCTPIQLQRVILKVP